jgi:fatty acid desaturase
MEQGIERVPVEADYRRRIRALVSDEELRELAQTSVADNTTGLVSIWLVTIALLTAADVVPRLATIWAFLVGCTVVMLITTRVNALSVMIHEAAHGCLARRRSRNDLIGNLCAGWWVLNTVEGYRATHNLHHRYLNTDRDPDLGAYLLPKRTFSILGRLAEDVAGVTATRRTIALARSQRGSVSGARRVLNVVGIVAAQLTLLILFAALNGFEVGVLLYAIFWLVPVACLFPLLLRVKTITEHFDEVVRAHPGEVFVSRTSTSGRLQDWLIGARMEYHFEHHVFPMIPYCGLRRLHALLVDRGFFDSVPREDRSLIVSPGYAQFVGSLATARVAPAMPAHPAPLPTKASTGDGTATR